MVLIRQTEAPLPTKESTYIDSPITGGQIGRMIDKTNHLALARSLRSIHFNNTLQTFSPYSSYTTKGDSFELNANTPSSGHTHEIPYLSTVNATHLEVTLKIRCKGTPSVTISLYTFVPGAPVAIDTGIEWTALNRGLVAQTYNLSSGDLRYDVQTLTTGSLTRGDAAGIDSPRPLIVPSLNRGSVLMVRIVCVDTDLLTADIFERFSEEWS